MRDVTLTPVEALSLPCHLDLLNRRPWHVGWDQLAPGWMRTMADTLVAPQTEFATSGSTGEPQTWELASDRLLAEAEMLTGILADRTVDAAVAFAPPRHRYGAVCSVLLTAALRVSTWVRPTASATLPQIAGRHWLVVAIPSTFAMLQRRPAWLREARSVTVLHSSSRLPDSALELLSECTDTDLTLIEILGSTETGAVATRSYPATTDAWTLVPGVEFAMDTMAVGREDRLTVSSPFLPARHAEPAPEVWELGDVVRLHTERSFELIGRASRLLKLNGRRYHLDDIESRFRHQLPGREIACLSVTDGHVGEHFELCVVAPKGDPRPTQRELREAIAAVGLHPRRVRLVPTLTKSPTGKVAFRQPPHWRTQP